MFTLTPILLSPDSTVFSHMKKLKHKGSSSYYACPSGKKVMANKGFQN